MPCRIVLPMIMLLSGVLGVAAAAGQDSSAGQAIPASWESGWQQPPLSDRPLQIVHGITLDPKFSENERAAAITNLLDAWQAHGLGGIVCNVPFDNYLQSADDWKSLAAVIGQCRERGLAVWIYDELGYPSGGAGGLVLKEDPAHEALELAYDASLDEPFVVRASYEFTHANNNYHASRRYTNLLDAEAVACFIRTTHGAYWQHLEPFFGDPIVAMFTDEPSLMAVSLGQIPEGARKTVPIVDPPDPNVKPLPAVPWCRDLPDVYRARFGEELEPQRLSLFTGQTETDRRVRRQFWSLIADLVAERYFGALGAWCQQRGVVSSGHTLSEHSLLLQLPLEGSALSVLTRMQIPGMDMLTSDPEAVIHDGWLIANLPGSAAALTGQRRVMTEVSDFAQIEFSQFVSGAAVASLAEMQATAAWQAAWGVTDFTLYYSQGDRSVEDYHAYCDFVGRLNAILKPAQRVPDVLLYYPMYDLWPEYLPTAQQLTMASQSARLQAITASFMQLGQMLQCHQIPFTLIDHQYLAGATITPDGMIVVGGQAYRAIVFPEGVELPDDAARQVALVQQRKARSVWQGERTRELASGGQPVALLQPDCHIEPASPQITVGHFLRDGRPITLVANVGRQPYAGRMAMRAGHTWCALDPASGAMHALEADAEGCLPLQLGPRETRLLVGSEAQ